MIEKKWHILPPVPQSFYDEHPELPTVVVNLLYHRNMQTQNKINEFLNPDYTEHIFDPYLFKDMDKTINRIWQAMDDKETITIHGDYDADGVCASTILTSAFRALGYRNTNVFLPQRETDGYGLNTNTIQLLNEGGTKLIITCDCGISNKKEIELANKLGIDVIITDHHSIPTELPPAYSIIHPKIVDESYPDKNLAGGAVAFKLMQAMLKKHKRTNNTLPDGQAHDAFEKWQLDMVSIASVGDMVPLIGESRTLTKYGLIVLNKTKRIGLQKLLLEAKLVDQDGTMKKKLTEETISFQIAPRINAAGRMDHANVAYNLMVAESATDAIDLAYKLDQNNIERKKLTEQLTKEAIIQIEPDQQDSPFLFVLGKNWPTGIIGLIASRIKERYQKPTMVMALNNGEITGSGRSIKQFDMIANMQSVPEFFEKFGGHPMACGFTLKSTDVLNSYKKTLIEKFIEETKNIDLSTTIELDAEICLEDIDWNLFDLLDKFKPFGISNPKPKYLARGLTVKDFKVIGKNSSHIIIMVTHNTPKIKKTIGWGMCDETRGDGKDWSKILNVGDKIDMVFEIDLNEWNGNRDIQLTIVDLKKI